MSLFEWLERGRTLELSIVETQTDWYDAWEQV